MYHLEASCTSDGTWFGTYSTVVSGALPAESSLFYPRCTNVPFHLKRGYVTRARPRDTTVYTPHPIRTVGCSDFFGTLVHLAVFNTKIGGTEPVAAILYVPNRVPSGVQLALEMVHLAGDGPNSGDPAGIG